MGAARRHARAFLFAGRCAFIGLVGGCGGSKAPPTTVSQEELFKTGNFNYDEYFEDLYDYQANAHHAVEDEHTARMPLGRALGTGEVMLDRTLEQMTRAVNEHAESKAHVRFKLDGVDTQGAPLAGKTVTVTAAARGRALPKDAAVLTLAIDQTAKAEGQVWERYNPFAGRGRRLSVKAGELLADCQTTFAAEPEAKRERVRRELEAAKTAAATLAESSEKAVQAATRFLRESQFIFERAARAEAPVGKPNTKSKAPTSSPTTVREGKKSPPRRAPGASPTPGGEAPLPAAKGSPDFNP